MPHPPTWPIAAGSLIVGFGIAEATGSRPLGGVALFLAALWCGLRWRREVGMRRAVQLVVLYLVAFALSHVLGLAIGAWPSVFVVAAAVAAATWAWGDQAASGGRYPAPRTPESARGTGL